MKGIGLITIGKVSVASRYAGMLRSEIERKCPETVGPHVLHYHAPCLGNFSRKSSDALVSISRRLLDFGVTQVLLGSSEIALHADALSDELGVPVPNPFCLTTNVVRRFRLTPVVLIGSRTALEERRWIDCLAAERCDLLLPTKNERVSIVMRLERGHSTPADRVDFVRMVVSYRSAGAKAVILADPVVRDFLHEEESVLPLVCAAEQQVKVAVEIAMGMPRATE